jgi:hypothetical protein
MATTLNNTATAKKIAADHGLAFSYVRGSRSWMLSNKAHAKHSKLYKAADVADFDTDCFYADCMEVAARTISPAQMEKVVIRARFSHMQDRLSNGETFAPNSADALEFVQLSIDAHCTDKQVHAFEHTIYILCTEAEEESGTYAEHRATFGPQKTCAACGHGCPVRAIACRACGVSFERIPAIEAAPVAVALDATAAPAARVAVIVEVVAVGFDGSTDATDDRVLWIGAPSVERVEEMLNALNVPRQSISATDLDPATACPPEVLDLEHEEGEIVARLFRFALDAAHPEETTARDMLRRLLAATCKPPGDAGKLYDDAQEFVRSGATVTTYGEEAAGPRACIEVSPPHNGPVRVEQFANKRFRVTYGQQVSGATAGAGLGYTAAAHEFGESVFHALACAGLLDNCGPL